jgi:Flp pilus assembly protein TadG
VNLPHWLRKQQSGRAADRVIDPGILAHFWRGGPPRPDRVRDIGHEGAYIETKDRWYVGTILALTLQPEVNDETNAMNTNLMTAAPEAGAPASMQVSCKVVRHGPDGVGVQFPRPDAEGRRKLRAFVAACMEAREKKRSQAGESLIEFVLLVPLLIFLIVNVVNWGGFIFAWITVANAARTGAQYAVLDSVSAGAPAAASGTLINNVITGDVFSLLNGTSPTINICDNYKGNVLRTISGTCAGGLSDPVTDSYVLTSVDVTYTYKPLIRSFPVLGTNFTMLGAKTTINIHRQTQMRRLQ